ncbi:MAG TPA: hypothetical protein VMH80_29100 [Bryobacteraceae bacterium]|nr:hypothetical protein [Bryobacteraceae bacterium]
MHHKPPVAIRGPPRQRADVEADVLVDVDDAEMTTKIDLAGVASRGQYAHAAFTGEVFS